MKEDKPSFTAEMDAVVRWVETEKPEGERLCYDPMARGFVSLTSRLVGMFGPIRRAALWYMERKHPCFQDCVPARTRYIDAYVKACIDNGLEQLVNLGAGYDSRAYRLDGLRQGQVVVFEVDHPATQKRKIEKVKAVLGSLPSNVVYVPVDFNRQKLGERLFQSGYNQDKKSLFIWEGVTPYLTAQAVDATLEFVAQNSGPGSSIIFSYMLKSVVDGTCSVEVSKVIRQSFSTGGFTDFRSVKGERLMLGIEEGTIEQFLSERGFCGITDISGDYYKAKYFKGANRNRKECCLCRVVYATVKPRE